MTDSKASPIGTVSQLRSRFTELVQARLEHDQAMDSAVNMHYTRPRTDTTTTQTEGTP